MKQGWESKKLGDVCTFVMGQAPHSKTYNNEGNGELFIRVGDFGVKYPTSDTYTTNPLVYGKKGDVFLCIVGATCGKVNYGINASITRSIAAIRPNNNLNQEFLFYYLYSNYDLFNKASSGSAQPILNKTVLSSFDFPLPPLEEQKQIVAKLDQCFEAVDKARANAAKNLENARELFQSKLNEIFSQKGEAWVEKKLGDWCIVERGSSPRPIKDYITESEQGVNWVKISDTKNVKKYIHTTKQRITKEGAAKSRFVDIGDFILSNSMSYGKAYIMKTQGYIHDGWFVLRLPPEINSEFFWYLLSSPFTLKQFEGLAAGAIVKNISGDLVKKTILPIPPIEKQKQLVSELDVLSKQTQSLESKYQQELNSLEELKKSILQKAFEGEL
jgi:type I restriction enzyme S subunit